MEERPTAADLGISEEVYRRVLADVERRSREEQQPLPPPSGRRWRLGGRSLASLGGLVLALTVVVASIGAGRAADDGIASYAFLHEHLGEPVAYTSCRRIEVAVYPAGGPEDAESLVREAVAVVRSVSGLDLVVTGSFGGSAPNWDFGDGPVRADDPISVSWQDGDAIAALTDDTAGLGGSRVLTYPDGSRRLVAGTIALSRGYYDLLEARGDREQALAVLLHELGHVLGLAHVRDAGELMNQDNIGRSSFGPGDREGLRLLGQGPCF